MCMVYVSEWLLYSGTINLVKVSYAYVMYALAEGMTQLHRRCGLTMELKTADLIRKKKENLYLFL